MSWSDVEWTIGDTCTEAKFDQMAENLAFLRENALAKTLATHAKTQNSEDGPGEFTQYSIQVILDGSSAIVSPYYTNTAFEWKAVENEGLTGQLDDENLHEVKIRFYGYYAGSWHSLDTRRLGHIVGGDGYDKISAYFQSYMTGSRITIRYLSIIGHILSI